MSDDTRMLDGRALRALAHPLRVQIYDILSQYGPQTASSLAAMTGESSGSTSYHLRALAKHDLIREVEDRGTARERWWERPRGGISLTNPEAMKTPSGKAATQVVMTEFLNRRHQQLMRYVAEGIQAPDDLEEDSAMISTATAHLTLEQTRELIARVQSVIDETVERYRDQEGEGVRPVSLRADIFPLPEEGH
ncbi:winged helix-turn-helix domain-containing protein [Microbacterium terricola]|uniref:Transcriptional regulator n=1 Tax=Microbacterium terricola TaxID=344163 RepID=A0ABM8DYZ6_9MICO|nr:helix-turn-helix domain-containing protein [Microbacterium terricola]UYK41449.1 helix-turn-helix domain-containing protein [Microbacterium terricola]BDV30761.1 transcriptional regulator [Microbacterium terricola]